MVHNSWRDEWELPGGLIEEGETAREAAEREFLEETGVPAGEVDFVGVGTVQLGHERRIEFVAIYRTVLEGRTEFEPERASSTRSARGTWHADLPGLSAIDAHLAGPRARPPGRRRPGRGRVSGV